MAAVTRTWTGAISSSWSEPNNWSPTGTPDASDSLAFPANVTMVNDLPGGFSAGPMAFSGAATLSGNPLTLTGNMSMPSGVSITCNADVTVGANVTLGNYGGLEMFNGAVDVNGKTLNLGAAANFSSLNGTGTVTTASNTQAVRVSGSGTFSGTIVDSEVILDGGSIPNAAVSGQFASVSGHGSIGNVTIGGSGGIGPAGVLHTKSLAITSNTVGTSVSLNAAGASDQLQVTGSVTLNGNLWVSFSGALPSPGQSFTIIDNDGTDAVGGTFNSLPEGATLTTASGVKLTISYHGGDGNDVTAAVIGTKIWTGNAGTLWSNPANWSPQAIPVAGEPLVFPANVTMVNDLPGGFSVGPMTFNGAATLSGNPLTVTGNESMASGVSITCNADVTVGANVTLGNYGSLETFNGAVDVNGKTLNLGAAANFSSLNGTGTVTTASNTQAVRVSGSGTFSGTIVDSEVILDGGSIPNAAVSGTFASVSGHGSIGNVTIGGSGGIAPSGVLRTKSLAITSSNVGTSISLNPAGTSDQLQVTGSVTLNGPLWVSFPGTLPAPGQSFTIIDNDGTDFVNGSFRLQWEGSTLTTASGVKLTISYHGGDGNDVTLTRVVDTSTVLTQSSTESLIGQPFTLTATVTSGAGTPTGTVSFGDFTTVYGIAPVQDGVATFTTSTLHAGVHNIVATYLGDGGFLVSGSAPVVHNVHRGGTVTTHALAAGTAVYGQARFDALTTVVAPAAGEPAGTVTLTADGIDLAAGSVSGGHASVVASALTAGTHTVVAAYGGSSDFEPSEGSTTVTIAKAPTSIGVVSAHNPSPAGAPVLLNINVSPAGPTLPSGMLTVTENGTVVAKQAINGTSSVLLHPGTGHHSLAISYSGNDNYLASSVNFDQDIAAPMLTADATRVFEGDAGTEDVEIPVRLSAASSDPISVPWHTADGTAHANIDYQQASGTIDFAPGETYHTVIVRVIGNTKKEDDKTFSVVFDAAANVQIATTSATVTIANDDGADTPPPARRRGVRH